MKTVLIAMGAIALTATPSLAQEPAAKAAPKCEKMKEGKMACETMDHSKMDHKKMSHGQTDQSQHGTAGA